MDLLPVIFVVAKAPGRKAQLSLKNTNMPAPKGENHDTTLRDAGHPAPRQAEDDGE
jgi:hypothetical protein